MPRSRTRDGLSGLLAVAVALGLAELLAALFGVTAPVAVVGDYVVDRSPGDLTKAVIEAFGTRDKPALLLGIVVSSLGLGALLGVAAGRHFIAGVAGFAAFGIAAALAGARLPQAAAVVPVLIAVVAAGSGLAVLRVLLAVATPQAAERAVEMPSEGARGSRREFFRVAAAAGGGAAVLAVMGRWVIGPRIDVEAARSAVVLPTAAPPTPVATGSTPVAVAAPGTRFDIDGLSPLITPNDEFFRIDTALVVPRVDTETWRLRVTGMVDEPLELSFPELLAMPAEQATVTLACVSNEVGGDLIGNAVWLGIPLVDLLAKAGVQPGATQIVARSVDGFSVGFPTEVALDGRTSMVAVGMNGEPLPVVHGFPARMIVPGLFGYVSATKWLAEIELTTLEQYDAYWIRRGWSKQGPIETQSRIDVPRSGQTVSAGRVTLAGVAWGGVRSVSAVEVRLTRDGENDGEWLNARLSEALSRSTWRQWAVEWSATPGDYRVEVRATDGDGETQTELRRRPGPAGATGYHAIRVRVREA
ncbi:MAG: molybdopterin-dependent oxidoreductase [Dehalococcoidia bacterium]